MAIDYNKGRYNVFGPGRAPIGRIDEDEFIRNGLSLLYRIDGVKIYSLSGQYLGSIDDGYARSLTGQLLFTIEAE